MYNLKGQVKYCLTVRPCQFFSCTSMSFFFLYDRVTFPPVRPCHFFPVRPCQFFPCAAVSRGLYTHVAVWFYRICYHSYHTNKVQVSLLASCDVPVLYMVLYQVPQGSSELKTPSPMLTMDIPIWQLRTTPFVVSIKLKADFWFLCFCLSKKVGSQTRRSEPFLGCADPAVGFISGTGSCLRLMGLIPGEFEDKRTQ